MLLLNGSCAWGVPYLHLIHRVKTIHDNYFRILIRRSSCPLFEPSAETLEINWQQQSDMFASLTSYLEQFDATPFPLIAKCDEAIRNKTGTHGFYC